MNPHIPHQKEIMVLHLWSIHCTSVFNPLHSNMNQELPKKCLIPMVLHTPINVWKWSIHYVHYTTVTVQNQSSHYKIFIMQRKPSHATTNQHFCCQQRWESGPGSLHLLHCHITALEEYGSPTEYNAESTARFSQGSNTRQEYHF